jgi:hypothetical protein
MDQDVRRRATELVTASTDIADGPALAALYKGIAIDQGTDGQQAADDARAQARRELYNDVTEPVLEEIGETLRQITNLAEAVAFAEQRLRDHARASQASEAQRAAGLTDRVPRIDPEGAAWRRSASERPEQRRPGTVHPFPPRRGPDGRAY